MNSAVSLSEPRLSGGPNYYMWLILSQTENGLERFCDLLHVAPEHVADVIKEGIQRADFVQFGYDYGLATVAPTWWDRLGPMLCDRFDPPLEYLEKPPMPAHLIESAKAEEAASLTGSPRNKGQLPTNFPEAMNYLLQLNRVQPSAMAKRLQCSLREFAEYLNGTAAPTLSEYGKNKWPQTWAKDCPHGWADCKDLFEEFGEKLLKEQNVPFYKAQKSKTVLTPEKLAKIQNNLVVTGFKPKRVRASAKPVEVAPDPVLAELADELLTMQRTGILDPVREDLLDAENAMSPEELAERQRIDQTSLESLLAEDDAEPSEPSATNAENAQADAVEEDPLDALGLRLMPPRDPIDVLRETYPDAWRVAGNEMVEVALRLIEAGDDPAAPLIELDNWRAAVAHYVDRVSSESLVYAFAALHAEATSSRSKATPEMIDDKVLYRIINQDSSVPPVQCAYVLAMLEKAPTNSLKNQTRAIRPQIKRLLKTYRALQNKGVT